MASVSWGSLILIAGAGFGLYFQLYEPPLPCRPEYKSLQEGEIRLLILSPGKGGDQVTCRLMPITLANTSEFEALSYVWGAPQPAGSISCGEKTVPVGPNLHSALRNLRHPSEERALWVDALCINQTDDVEKSQQLPLMGDIYQNASRVLIWLGEPTEATQNALPALREVSKYLKKTIWLHTDSFAGSFARAWLFNRFRRGQGKTLTPNQVDELAAFDWASIVALIGHKWFRRVWIYQEISKARKAVIVVGRDEMPWSILMSAFSELDLQGIGGQVTSPHMVFEDFLALMTLRDLGIRERDMVDYYIPRPQLLELVFKARTRDATDDRDRIFAFLGLASDVDVSNLEPELVPDYTIPAEEVYMRFALWSLLQKDNLRILQYASLNLESSLAERRLPSWVPDWRGVKSSVPIFQNLEKPFNAFPDSKPWVHWHSDQPAVLQIKGRIVDRIDQVAVTEAHILEHKKLWWWTEKETEQLTKEVERDYNQGRGNHPLARRWIEAKDAIMRFGGGLEEAKVVWMMNCWTVVAMGARRLNREQFESWWRTLTVGQPSNFSRQTFADYSILIMEIQQGKRGLAVFQFGASNASFNDIPGLTEQELRELEMIRKMNVILAPFFQRRFCATSGKRLGWVPLMARPGDLICIFDGAEVPFVLRPLAETKPTTKKLGKAEGSMSQSSLSSSVTVRDKEQLQYELVGEAYVDGIMYGGAVRGSEDKSQIFHLV